MASYTFPRWGKNVKISDFLEKSDYPLPSNITITPFTEDSTSNLSTGMMQNLSPNWDHQNIMVTLGQLKAGLTFPLFHSNKPLLSQILTKIEPSCCITQLTGNSIRILNEWCLRAEGETNYPDMTRIPIDMSFYTVANFLDQYKCIWGDRGSARWGLRFVTNTAKRTHFLEDVDFSDTRNVGVRHSSDSDWLKFPLLVKGDYVGAGAPEDFKPWVINLNEENLRTDADDLQAKEKEAQNQGKTKATSTKKRKAPAAAATVSDIVNTIPLPEAPKKKKSKSTKNTKTANQAAVVEPTIPDITQQPDPITSAVHQEEEEKEKEVSLPSPNRVQQTISLKTNQSILQSFAEASGPIPAVPLQSKPSSSHQSNDESLVTQALTTLASISPNSTSSDLALSTAFQNACANLVQTPFYHLSLVKKAVETTEATLKKSEANLQQSQAALKEASAKLTSAQDLASKNLKVVKEASDAEIARLEKEIELLKVGQQEAENARLEAEAKLLDQEKLAGEKAAAEQRIKQMEDDYVTRLPTDCHAYLVRYLRREGLPVPGEESGTTEGTVEGGEEEEITTEEPTNHAESSAKATSDAANPPL